jgi:hypothetical protein
MPMNSPVQFSERIGQGVDIQTEIKLAEDKRKMKKK